MSEIVNNPIKKGAPIKDPLDKRDGSRTKDDSVLKPLISETDAQPKKIFHKDKS